MRDSLLEALREEPRVCPHLHVPLQSGDDGVLAAMGRHYTAAEYLEAIAALRAAVPHVNVTTDVHRRLPRRGRGGLPADARAGRARPASAACTPSPTPPVPARPRRRSATACPRRRRSAARGSCAASRRCARATTARRKLGAHRVCAGGQGRRHSVRGVHPRLHALLPAGRRGGGRRGGGGERGRVARGRPAGDTGV